MGSVNEHEVMKCFFGNPNRTALVWRQVELFVNHIPSDTRESSLLFSYAKELSESGALDEGEKPQDVTGELQWKKILILLLLE